MEQIVLTPRLHGVVADLNDDAFESLSLPSPAVRPLDFYEHSAPRPLKPQRRDKVAERLYRDRSHVAPTGYPERGRTLERGRRRSYEPPAATSRRGHRRESRSTYQMRSTERVQYHTFDDEVLHPLGLTPEEFLFRPQTDAQLRGQKRRERNQRRSDQVRRRWEEMGYVYDLEGAMGFGEARGRDQGLIVERKLGWFRCPALPWKIIVLVIACIAIMCAAFWILKE